MSEITDELRQEWLEKLNYGFDSEEEDVPKKLLADKEVVLEAVKQDGSARRFASKELQNDPDVLAACKND